jgi:hypothetical protein
MNNSFFNPEDKLSERRRERKLEEEELKSFETLNNVKIEMSLDEPKHKPMIVK